MGWVFIKIGKGRKETFFLFNVWGCFEIILYKVRNIVSTLFKIGHIGYLTRKKQLITNMKKYLIMFQCLIVGSSITITIREC